MIQRKYPAYANYVASSFLVSPRALSIKYIAGIIDIFMRTASSHIHEIHSFVNHQQLHTGLRDELKGLTIYE